MNIDSQLLKSAHEGDRKAQYALYRICFPVLMSVCMRYRRDKQDAILILNNGFLKIIQHLDRYKMDETPFEAWIRRIMINTAIDEFRREKKWREQTVFTDEIERSYNEHPINWNEADQRLDIEHLEALLRQMGRDLMVTELLGQGVNGVTGDYSRGASGFWVEGGEIAFPVHEVTIAGNLRDMYRHVVAIGADVDTRGSLQTGSWLLEELTIAGE